MSKMGVRILHDAQESKAVLYDSTTMWAFGPVVGWGESSAHPIDRLNNFTEWLEESEGVGDARGLAPSELSRLWDLFGKRVEDEG